MKKSIKIRVVFSIIATIVAMTSILSINALAADINSQNNSIGDQKIYANANINDSFADNAVLVMFSNKVSLQCNAFNINDFNEVELKSVKNLSSLLESRVTKAKENIVRSVTQGEPFILDSKLDMSEFNQVYRLELLETGKDEVLEAIEILEKREDIIYVGPDYIWAYCSDDYDEIHFINDFSEKWAYTKIQLEEARDVMRENNISEQTIRIAVFDSGIDTSHPALDHNIVNENDSDIYGNDCYRGAVVDSYGHGTNVAGIIFGVAQTVELISFKISESGYPLSSAALEAIIAISICDIPIPIMNFGMSWQVNQDAQTGGKYDAIISDALRDYDGLIVCPAGNNSANIDNDNKYDYYPIQYSRSNMIVVGASTQTDGVKEDSNYGVTYVDVFAPGELIYTTNNNHGYEYVGKTSMATPFVTGLAAMLLMVNEDLTPEMIIDIIKSTVDTEDTDNPNNGDNIGDLADACTSGGRINALEAVKAAKNYNTCNHTTTSYTKTSTKHTEKCLSCGVVISTAPHTWQYTGAYDKSGHNAICSVCSYSAIQSHILYMYEDNGNDGCTVKCNNCTYTIECDEAPEYDPTSSGHYASCPSGCYSLFEVHNNLTYLRTSSQYYHTVTCGACGYSYSESHSWVQQSTSLYRCTLCGMLSDQDVIMSLPPEDEELTE